MSTPAIFYCDEYDKDRQDAMFYAGFDAAPIASVTNGRRVCDVWVVGATVGYVTDGNVTHIVRNGDEWSAHGIRTDADIERAIDAERLDIQNNSWFELRSGTASEDGLSIEWDARNHDFSDVYHDIDAAVAAATQLAEGVTL